MNKHITLLNELKSCAEKDVNGIWDIWFRGRYLGYIHKVDGEYISSIESDIVWFSVVKTNYSSAINQFVAFAYAIESEASIKTDNEFKRWGLSKKPSLWAKIKGWIYD